MRRLASVFVDRACSRPEIAWLASRLSINLREVCQGDVHNQSGEGVSGGRGGPLTRPYTRVLLAVDGAIGVEAFGVADL